MKRELRLLSLIPAFVAVVVGGCSEPEAAFPSIASPFCDGTGSDAGTPTTQPDASEASTGPVGPGPVGTGGQDTSCIFSTADQPVQVAFCDGFNAPGTKVENSRAGDLDNVLWGVSHASGENSQGNTANGWGDVQLDLCGTMVTASPPNDIRICNGQLHEATNDGVGGVTVLAMYPKQPFDFTGRTGTVVFDVSNDTNGPHAAWPEFWLTDKPVPAPIKHQESWSALPRHGLGLIFDVGCPPNTGCDHRCYDPESWTTSLGSALAVRDYVPGDLTVESDQCVKESKPGQLNHMELRISQNKIDVYGTDGFAGVWNPAASPLKHLATIQNANLSATRGLIWMTDDHYSAFKTGNGEQINHNFTWDNVGFDGPKTYRDLAFDVPDNTQPVTTSGGQGTNLGYFIGAGTSKTFTVKGVAGGTAATGALLTLNYYFYDAPTSIDFTINGHVHSEPLSFPAGYPTGYTTRTIAIPVPLSEIVAGDNTLTISANSHFINVSNIDLILVAGASVP